MLRFLKYSLIFLTFPLSAWIEPPPGHFAFQSELLYFAPSCDETYFVINGSGITGLEAPTPDGKRINNPVGYNFGWRVLGMYGLCNSCCDLSVRWTHVFATSRKSVTNTLIPAQLWPTYVIPGSEALSVSEPFAGEASSRINVMYQKLELLLDEKGWNLCGCHFTLREGVEWSYLRYHEIVTYQESGDSSETFQFHGHTKGLGPQIGMIILCEPWHHFCWFPKNLGFKFLTTASLIAANSKAKVKTFDVLGAENHVSQSSFWRFVPEVAFSFGFNYANCICCHPVSLEISYEMTTYFRGISKLIFDAGAHPGSSSNQYSDFYVHGLSLAAGVVF